jgi:hypothetical protein
MLCSKRREVGHRPRLILRSTAHDSLKVHTTIEANRQRCKEYPARPKGRGTRKRADATGSRGDHFPELLVLSKAICFSSQPGTPSIRSHPTKIVGRWDFPRISTRAHCPSSALRKVQMESMSPERRDASTYSSSPGLPRGGKGLIRTSEYLPGGIFDPISMVSVLTPSNLGPLTCPTDGGRGNR